jgi:hypothetical protein
MSSVTFSTTVGGDGSTVTDDDNATTGLGNGGSLIRLVPMMQQVVNVAAYAVSISGGAGNDAIAAAASASAASSSATAAAASYDSFDDRYLGAKSSDPTLDNDGNALLTGAIYWNSSTSVMKVWSGSAWVSYNPAISYLPTAGGTMTGNIVFNAGQTFTGTLPLAGGTMTGAITFAAGQKLLNWTIKTTTYNPAVAGDNILADTTSSAFTITLPASAVLSDTINIADYKGTFATNNLTINSNGLNLMGSVQTLILNVNYRNVTLVYSGATQGWVIVL